REHMATTIPGWEARPASEFTHFDSGRLQFRSNEWLNEAQDRFLTSLASITSRYLLIAGAVIVAIGLGWTSIFGFDSNPSATSLVQKSDSSLGSFGQHVRHTDRIANPTASPIAASYARPAAPAANPRQISAVADRPQKTVTPRMRQRTSPP